MSTNPLSADLIAWGGVFTPCAVHPGDWYWQLIRAEGPQKIGGNHHLYVDILGQAGQRMVGVPVEFFWADGNDIRPSEPKTGEPYAMSFPLYAGGQAYGVRVADGKPSDSLFGVGLGNFVTHHSFVAVFRLTVAEPVSVDPQPVPLCKDEG